MVPSIATHNTNNSILHTGEWFQVQKANSFIYTQLNGSKYCYVSLTIQLNTSHLFTHCLNSKQFYLTHREDPTRCYDSGPE